MGRAALLAGLVVLMGPQAAEVAGGQDSRPAGLGPRDARARAEALRKHGGGRDTETAVERGLNWLARHEREGGGWDADGFPRRCVGEACEGLGKGQHGEDRPCPFDASITALATLAFLGHGHHPGLEADPAGQIVARALRRLEQAGDLFSLPLCALAFSEAAHLDGDPRHRRQAHALCTRLLEQRGEDGAWGYASGFRPGSDVPYTWLVAQALFAARQTGFVIPEALPAELSAYLDTLEADDGALAYLLDGRRHGYTPTTCNGHFAAEIRELLDVDRDGVRHRAHLARVLKTLPEWEIGFREVEVPGRGLMTVQTGHLSMLQWWAGTTACFHAGGSTWRRWSRALHPCLLDAQCARGCARGSWNPQGTYERQTGGRVFSTALGVLMLEQAYRHRRR